jgi:hypothetical protein
MPCSFIFTTRPALMGRQGMIIRLSAQPVKVFGSICYLNLKSGQYKAQKWTAEFFNIQGFKVEKWTAVIQTR